MDGVSNLSHVSPFPSLLSPRLTLLAYPLYTAPLSRSRSAACFFFLDRLYPDPFSRRRYMVRFVLGRCTAVHERKERAVQRDLSSLRQLVPRLGRGARVRSNGHHLSLSTGTTSSSQLALTLAE